MIITDFIITSLDNIEHYKELASKNIMHSFTIVSIEDTDYIDLKKLTFSFDNERVAYLMSDVFYIGKRAGILEFSNKSNETTY